MVDAVSGLGATSPSLANSQTGLADNFEMFLTLLTEQMKNQDPLNPLDSTQFVNQLVDFSSVEQQIAQNQNLENLLLLQSAAAQSASVSYIGRVATALTPQAMLANGEASWEYNVPEEATTSSIIIRDEDDRIVARRDGETTAGTHDFTWDGLGDGGAALDDGVYSMEIIAQNADGDDLPVTIRAAAQVTGVDLSGSEVIVEMGGIRVPLSSVMSIKDANTT
ncbi:MAG: flagellar basal-body rod modification protein FlgD [Maricaulis maris]|jgi:flagellar basal-body rod modification protein FlgD|uniref:Basal-body rod modification protein FlgD n=1 Tax=Maricaulis maris (strain MCS10) TaxID=394221 RepID=Q0ARV5_MARMM|nr:flagellar hook capping FlgD N-terminal domain-containing protein [Maricaulis maris]ABI64982.1 flagellar hook capping protein [Maricaulis maris MCS10]